MQRNSNKAPEFPTDIDTISALKRTINYGDFSSYPKWLVDALYQIRDTHDSQVLTANIKGLQQIFGGIELSHLRLSADRDSVLSAAVKNTTVTPDIVQSLLEIGFDPEQTNVHGQQPQHLNRNPLIQAVLARAVEQKYEN